jgi:hypothetical protein
MATAKELYIWAATVRKWAEGTTDPETVKAMLRLAAELDRLAERKGATERQLV